MCKNITWNASHLKLLQLPQFYLVTWSIGGILMCLPMMLFFLLIGYAGQAMIYTGLPVLTYPLTITLTAYYCTFLGAIASLLYFSFDQRRQVLCPSKNRLITISLSVRSTRHVVFFFTCGSTMLSLSFYCSISTKRRRCSARKWLEDYSF